MGHFSMIRKFVTLDLLPLGMERKIIKNTDISGSGAIDTSWYNARLFNPAEGLCAPNFTTDLYLQVNFSKPVTVNAVAMQGDIVTGSLNRLTYDFRVDNQTRGTVSICYLQYFIHTFNLENLLRHGLLLIKMEDRDCLSDNQ